MHPWVSGQANGSQLYRVLPEGDAIRCTMMQHQGPPSWQPQHECWQRNNDGQCILHCCRRAYRRERNRNFRKSAFALQRCSKVVSLLDIAVISFFFERQIFRLGCSALHCTIDRTRTLCPWGVWGVGEIVERPPLFS